MTRIPVLVTPDYEEAAPARYFLKRAYTDAVAAAGGLPLVVAYGGDVGAYLALGRALVVTGGAFDIPPEDYGEAKQAHCGPEKRERTAFEKAVLEGALARGLPVLGVCGGMQLLNVVRGGTLFQDVTVEVPGALPHEQATPKEEPAHALTVEAGSHVARAAALAPGPLGVNTTHHQAVKRVGANLVVTARAEDGVVEAIEDPTAPFVVGVQWHPELLRDRWNLKLYEGLVEAARR